MTPNVIASHFKKEFGDNMQRSGSHIADSVDTYQTKVIAAADPRALSSKMQDAKKTEIRNLLKRETFKIILKEDMPRDNNELPGRFILAIKSNRDG